MKHYAGIIVIGFGVASMIVIGQEFWRLLTTELLNDILETVVQLVR